MTDIKRHLLVEDWRSWPIESEKIKWGVPEAILAFLGAQSVGILWTGYLTAAIYDDDRPSIADMPIGTVILLALGSWAGYLLFPVFMNRTTKSGPMVDFDLRITPRQLAVAAALGAAVQLVVIPVIYYPLLQIVDSDPGETAERLALGIDTPVEILLFFAMTVVVGPFAEEWFYRGMLLPALARRYNPMVGILGSTTLFTLVHWRPITFPGIFAIGLVMALITMKTRRLAPAIVTHMGFNAVTAIALVFF